MAYPKNKGKERKMTLTDVIQEKCDELIAEGKVVYLRNNARNQRLFDMFLQSDYWMAYKESIKSSLSYSDTDRCERTHQASKNGSDGSYTYEVIEDWIQAVNDWGMDTGYYRISECMLESIADCENWHERNGSLYNQVG